VTPDTPEFTLTNLTQPTGPGAPKRRTGLLAGLIAGSVVVLVGLAVGAYVLFGRGMTVSGVLVLTDQSSGIQVGQDGSTCTGTGAFQDITGGATVNITDAGSATVGLGALDAGRYDTTKGCVFPWKISGVPGGKGFYGIEVAHRGIVKFPEAEVRKPVSLTLS